ncbi:hypothetical protein MUG78_03280 [Gordonia alkaliphila]|uniref:hypothetical protein n=1 Tax=Gordonia alkaliphila TaxID=1053547 RepID=UPI001FF42DDC|nr:hypothetical protein [Gordonia alkaliphila]MCK0438512.1 hypothetical protein [Gordonia alkaliphila]
MDTTRTSRSGRRRVARLQAREQKKRFGARGWRTATLALGATAALSVGLLAGTMGNGLVLADDSVSVEMSPEMILGLLDDEMLTGFVEMCRTGALANGNPNAGNSTAWNAEDTAPGQVPPNAIATCNESTGHGLALVLPDTFEIGRLGNDMVMDLGPDQEIKVLGITVLTLPMGQQNLLNLVSGLIFEGSKIAGIVSVKEEAKKQTGIAIDPRMFAKYGDHDDDIYAAIQRDAALPYKEATRTENGKCLSYFLGVCTKYEKITVVYDANLEKRTDALKVAEYLTGHRYDPTVPQNLPDIPRASGQSTIKGDGINVALSMRGGQALAETASNLSVALAGADNGKISTAYANYAIAIAANMNTEDIRFTWFGQDVDFANLLPLLQSDMAAGMGGSDMAPMLDMLEGLNGQIPSIKEVYCLGVDAKATAEGLGSCTNFLGTFDTYKDLRPLSNGSQNFTGDSVSRQQQWGLTDISSLALGNDALLQQFLPMLSGGEGADLGALLSNPTVVKMLGAVLSEDDRLKLTKDFIRYTKNVETVFAKEPVLDANGDPVLVDGEPLLRNKVTPRMVGATESAWEDYVSDAPVMVDDADADGNPIYVDADGNVVDADTEGATKRQVQKLDDDGKPVFATKTRHLTKPVMIEQLDADGNPVLDADGNPVLVQKMEQAKDSKGNLLWDPVVESSITAHWLTSDYGLREPLTIEWLGHQVVFFPAVEVNGTYRPNLIGLPQIKRIASDAQTGLLPKISLVQWDNAFGLGTWSFDKPWDLFGTSRNFIDSVTLPSDLKAIDGALGLSAGIRDGIDVGIGDVKDFVDQGFGDLWGLLNPGGTTPDESVPDDSTPDPVLPGDGDDGDDDGAPTQNELIVPEFIAPETWQVPSAVEPPAVTPEPSVTQQAPVTPGSTGGPVGAGAGGSSPEPSFDE